MTKEDKKKFLKMSIVRAKSIADKFQAHEHSSNWGDTIQQEAREMVHLLKELYGSKV